MGSVRRLIDANEAYEIARLHHKDFAQSMADLTSLREVLEDAPTVDAVEVVHGRWISIGGNRYTRISQCSNCCAKYDFMSNYCPNCGAKMDGGNEDG